MPRKPRERYKDRAKAEATAEAKSRPKMTPEALRKRRNRRLIFLGIVAALFPALEVIAYRFRAITLVLENRSDEPISRIKVIYPGGGIESAELKPGGSITRVIRPDFTLKGEHFGTYPLTIRFATADAGWRSQIGRVGSIDFSATERYVVVSGQPGEPAVLQHSTSPGFPLNLIRDLLARLGIG